MPGKASASTVMMQEQEAQVLSRCRSTRVSEILQDYVVGKLTSYILATVTYTAP